MTTPSSQVPAQKVRVLFLCTANSARSQIAEAFARHHGSQRIDARSAGTSPTEVHPMAIAVMKEKGIDISAARAKGIADVPPNRQIVITLCDEAAADCPALPGVETMLHWSIPDPARATGDDDEIAAAFRRVRDGIEQRVLSLVEDLGTSLDDLELVAGDPDL